MSSDPVPSIAEPGSDPPDREEVHGPARVNDDHAQRIAELFQEEHAKVVHMLVPRTDSWAEAREIAAEAFAQVLAVKDPRTVSFFKAYIYKAACNIATNRRTSGAIRRRIQQGAAYDPNTASPSPEPLWCERERLEILHRAIERLAPRCRMALVLRIWDQLPYQEIVHRFATKGIAVNERTVRRWIVYALEHCREEILQAEGMQRNSAR